MRFKAKLAPEHVSLLYNLIGPISRLAPSSSSSSSTAIGSAGDDGGGGISGSPYLGGGGTVIHLDPDHVRISTRGTGGGGGGGGRAAARAADGFGGSGGGGTSATDGEGISCFAELTTRGGIFLEHRIESAADDVIVFEIDLGQLKVALQSVLSGLGGSGGGGGGGGGGFSRSATAGGGRHSQASSNPLHNSMAPDGGVGGAGAGANTFAPNTTITPTIVVMKLAKRNGGLPCLCIDANTLPGRGAVEVHHAIPIRIMRAAEMQYHLPPRISMPDVQLELPFDRPLKTVVERLKTMSPHIYIDGSMAGELALRLDGDAASIRNFYPKLIPRFEDIKENEQDSPSKGGGGDAPPSRCTLKVDSRKLSACLQWQGTMLLGRAVGSAVLCMVENEMLCLHCMLNPGTIGFFTYYVPVHYLSEDQMD
mmetsp:Transcript_12770/g.26403  ORF Transcript_12770/g.26403 Transcript_12770/m.26403 type:complete len:423 (+) Transcript_12770:243-1511(+)|eukprot:CAMPEP_0178714110 /NCGR_PEP_ID=MMETSP0699-20121125/19856_1 /TAXON_ID=265572 /ORGANISM="Extubocellulus spinifer, Strain CCMP396" /LENGTH=422 /DNA_ID=CAMNT_0020363137 /DNA_START=205 /DNA_END=1473 /DNA_ORIENTATION=+